MDDLEAIMGFFSWTCAKTQLPIMATAHWGADPDIAGSLCDAVLIAPEGVVARGRYDGYGRLGGFDIIDGGYGDLLDEGDAALVLSRWYDGERLGELEKRSLMEPGQGFFHEREELLQRIEAVLQAGGRAPAAPEGDAVATGMHRLLHLFHNDAHDAAFAMRVVGRGDRYGKDMMLTHALAEPMVEFYDRRWMFDRAPDGTELGQFVSRYFLSTLLEPGRDGLTAFHRKGLMLDGGTGWQVGPEGLKSCLDTLIAAGLASATPASECPEVRDTETPSP